MRFAPLRDLCVASAFVVSFAGFAGQTYAQTIPSQLPSGAVPGRQTPKPLEAPTTGKPGTIIVPGSPAIEIPKGAEEASFVLKDVQINGATAFSADELASFYRDMIGKKITVADAFKMAGKIELKYRNAGFVTSRVVVPPQQIDNGQFRIQVVEGFISDVVVQENVGSAKAAITRLLSPLLKTAPVSIKELERRLLLANDLAGMTVRGTLKPANDAPGGSVLLVEAERKAVDASLSVDNRNSPYVGGEQWKSVAKWNSFGPNADQLTFLGQVSSPLKRAWTVSGNYQGMFSDNGQTFGMGTTYSQSKPGLELNSLRVESKTFSQTFSTTYPVIRSRLQNLRLSGEYEYRRVNTDLLDDPFNRDRMHIVRAGLSYDLTDSFNGITAVRATLHEGLPIFDATDKGDKHASRSVADASFTKATVDLTRVQQLPKNFSLLLTATGQYSHDPLLSSEQLALGGANYGRGFDDSAFSGDNGWATSLELRYTPDLPKLFPHGVQLYTFIDRGQVWNVHGYHDHTDLASAGGGVRVNVTKNVYASLELARGLSKPDSTTSTTPQAFFALSVHY